MEQFFSLLLNFYSQTEELIFFNLSFSLKPQTMASWASEPQSENVADFDWNCLLSKLLYYANANFKFLDESF